jgi:hypothetical protein
VRLCAEARYSDHEDDLFLGGDGSREATRESLFVTITAMPKEYIFRPIYDHPRRGYSRKREDAKYICARLIRLLHKQSDEAFLSITVPP